MSGKDRLAAEEMVPLSEDIAEDNYHLSRTARLPCLSQTLVTYIYISVPRSFRSLEYNMGDHTHFFSIITLSFPPANSDELLHMQKVNTINVLDKMLEKPNGIEGCIRQGGVGELGGCDHIDLKRGGIGSLFDFIQRPHAKRLPFPFGFVGNFCRYAFFI